MTERQIISYMSRISNNDPNRTYFIDTIVPGLRSTRFTASKGNRSLYICPVCESVDKKVISFTIYSALIRHLNRKHYQVLPCNGNVFRNDTDFSINEELNENENTNRLSTFRCIDCKKDFARLEGLNRHYESIYHKRIIIFKQNKLEIDENSQPKEEMIVEDPFYQATMQIHDTDKNVEYTINEDINVQSLNIFEPEDEKKDSEHELNNENYQFMLDYETVESPCVTAKETKQSSKRTFSNSDSDKEMTNFKKTKGFTTSTPKKSKRQNLISTASNMIDSTDEEEIDFLMVKHLELFEKKLYNRTL